jgi:hypothetical protein
VATFEWWATSVSDFIEEKLGFKNVTTEVFEDHAIWQSRLNRGIARPDEDGKKVTVVFDAGPGHRYDLTGNVADAGAEVVGRLLGMT